MPRVFVHVASTPSRCTRVGVNAETMDINVHELFDLVASDILYCARGEMYDHYEFALINDHKQVDRILVLDYSMVLVRSSRELVMRMCRTTSLVDLGIVDGQNIAVRRVDRAHRLSSWDSLELDGCDSFANKLVVQSAPFHSKRTYEGTVTRLHKFTNVLVNTLGRCVRLDRLTVVEVLAAVKVAVENPEAASQRGLQLYTLKCAYDRVKARLDELLAAGELPRGLGPQFGMCRPDSVSIVELRAALAAVLPGREHLSAPLIAQKTLFN